MRYGALHLSPSPAWIDGVPGIFPQSPDFKKRGKEKGGGDRRVADCPCWSASPFHDPFFAEYLPGAPTGKGKGREKRGKHSRANSSTCARTFSAGFFTRAARDYLSCRGLRPTGKRKEGGKGKKKKTDAPTVRKNEPSAFILKDRRRPFTPSMPCPDRYSIKGKEERGKRDYGPSMASAPRCDAHSRPQLRINRGSFFFLPQLRGAGEKKKKEKGERKGRGRRKISLRTAVASDSPRHRRIRGKGEEEKQGQTCFRYSLQPSRLTA